MRNLQPDAKPSEDDAGELLARALTTAEALLVWGMRHWVACMKRGGDPMPLLTAGFGSGGVAAAGRLLDTILLITLETAFVPRDVRCPGSATVGEGEIDLLAAVALQQAGREREAEAWLRRWLPPGAARNARDLVAELAAELHHRRLRVPMRREYGAWRDGGKQSVQGYVGPASPTIH